MHSAPRFPRVYCSTVLPEPARRCSLVRLPAKPVCRSSRFRVLTSSRCSWVSVRAGSATCSSRPKKPAPAIIFIDEIDAVGRHRGAGMGGGHDEREQTLNQMLVEMDGFEANTGVILIAATNRPDILDPALLAPWPLRSTDRGRQTRSTWPPADLAGACQGKPFGARSRSRHDRPAHPRFHRCRSAEPVERGCAADRSRRKDEISTSHVGAAIDRVIGGPERKSRVMSDHEQRVIAYHESGHALVGHVLAAHRSGAQGVDRVSRPRPRLDA